MMVHLALDEVENAAATSTVFIVDDDGELRQMVSMLARSVGLASEVYASAQEFLERYDSQKAGCLVLDIRMPGMSGLELQKILVTQKVRPPIIFVTGIGDIPMAIQAVRAGAVDFIQKPFRPQALLERIQEAILLDKDNRRKLKLTNDIHQRLRRLTDREREIMRLLASGDSTKQIAKQLSISPKTVDNHRARILEKLDVENATQLAQLLAQLH